MVHISFSTILLFLLSNGFHFFLLTYFCKVSSLSLSLPNTTTGSEFKSLITLAINRTSSDANKTDGDRSFFLNDISSSWCSSDFLNDISSNNLSKKVNLNLIRIASKNTFYHNSEKSENKISRHVLVILS